MLNPFDRGLLSYRHIERFNSQFLLCNPPNHGNCFQTDMRLLFPVTPRESNEVSHSRRPRKKKILSVKETCE